MKSPRGKAPVYQPVERATVDRFASLTYSFMDRFVALMRSGSPDPRLSYPRFRILAWIHSSGPMSVGSMASSLRIARSTASELVGRMVRDGLVSKSSAQADGRSVEVMLSPLGQRLVQRRNQQLWQAYRRMFGAMSPAEREEFEAAFESMERILRRTTR